MSRENLPRTVLIVDDEALIRWSLSEGLSDAGWAVQQASSGDAARAAVRALDGHPFLILLDLRLPDVADLSLLLELRRTRPDVPLILMTAHGTNEDASQALAAGAFAVVGKPFDVSEMVSLADAAYRQE